MAMDADVKQYLYGKVAFEDFCSLGIGEKANCQTDWWF